MFFHIDESGNTGNHLFDSQQPRLSYGLLSSPLNADVLCRSSHRQIQKEIGCEIVHANELGVAGLTAIAGHLIQIQKRMRFDFDYYFVEKTTYALVSFFEAVFDAGLNEAVKWEWYWTPMRFVLIHKLVPLFDEELLQRSWSLCTAKRVDQHTDDISELLTELKRRAQESGLDERSIEIIVDALDFGISRPLSLDFGSPDPHIVSPNTIGFQSVVSAIARRVRKKRRKHASSIIVDRQTQFNNAQIETHRILRRFSEGMKSKSEKEKRAYLNHPLFVTLSKADIAHKDLPSTSVTVASSPSSIGLQIVDVYLWIANRIFNGAELSSELVALWNTFAGRSLVDGISFKGMEERFLRFDQLLPHYNDLTVEQLEAARASVERHRAKVQALQL